MTDNITLDRVSTSAEFDLISMYDNANDTEDNDSPFRYNVANSCYYEPSNFQRCRQTDAIKDQISLFHLNCRGLSANWNPFQELIYNLNSDTFSFDLIGISEIYRCINDERLHLTGYQNIISRCREDGPRGGVGIFVKDNLVCHIRNDIGIFIPHIFESIFIEISNTQGKHLIVGVVYRPNSGPHADLDIFSSTLHDIMDNIQHENKSCVIMGDMNIDLLKCDNHIKTNEYLDNIITHGYLPVITKPTRICSSTATLIDHIYINDISSTHHSGIIITDVADHFGTFLITKNKKQRQRSPILKTRSLSQANIQIFKDNLDKLNFRFINDIECPNIAYNEFMNLYITLFNKSFPLRNSTSSNSMKREPWFTFGLQTSSRTKAKLFITKLKKPTNENIQKYKKFNNVFNTLKRKMKILYYKQIIEENKHDIKKCWSILKQALGKMNNKTAFPNEFLINNVPVSDKNEIAESFNVFFANIGARTSQNVPTTNKCFTSFLPRSQTNSMFIQYV